MNQKFTTVESLLASERFQNHCVSPNAESEKFWKDWLVENESMRPAFEEAKALVLALNAQVLPGEVGEEFHRFRKNLRQQHTTKQGKGRRRLLYLFAKAAAVVLLLGAGFWIWNGTSEAPPTVVATNFGETKNIDLPDGSKVILNANSEISFVKNWKSRVVNLKGEAFFEVETDPSNPFLVKTKKGTIRVLGTKFNTLQRNDLLDVTLVEGKVQIALPTQSKINLQPNERVRINGKTIDHEKVDPSNVVAWRENKMKFKNASISSVIERFKNDFGWEIEVKNESLLKRKINASIPENNPQLLLDALTQIYDLKVEKKSERQYVIR